MNTTITNAINTVLQENGIISEESKTKVCIITDMAKMLKLNNAKPFDVNQFDTMYDMSVSELEIMAARLEDDVRRSSNIMTVDWMNIGKD